MGFRRDEKFIYLAITRERRLANFHPAGKFVQSSTPSAARFAQLYQPSPPRSRRIALFDPLPPSQKLTDLFKVKLSGP